MQAGMVLEGVVTNVTKFGAFVDIGVHQDGLVHISELSNRYIKEPSEAVKAGQIVKVKVLSVDTRAKRIALSIKALAEPSSRPVPNPGKSAPIRSQRGTRNSPHSLKNGTLIGTIEKIDPAEQELFIRFDDRLVTYDFGELDEVSLAYAVTIHKSQGSEFPAVVIPVAMQHYMLLQRNLIYTGITRAKRLLVVVGQKKAMGLAVRNDRSRKRYSGLLSSLKAPSV